MKEVKERLRECLTHIEKYQNKNGELNSFEVKQVEAYINNCLDWIGYYERHDKLKDKSYKDIT